MATFSCLALPASGLTLTPPSHPSFAALVEDIRQRSEVHHPGSPFPASLEFAAVLLNQGPRALAGLALEWRYEAADGSHYSSRSLRAFGRGVLLPFGARPQDVTVDTYWSTIFPGSKRLLAESVMCGDNTGVRPPAEDEIRRGGIRAGGGGGGNGSQVDTARLRAVTLAIDGAFFSDGLFAGANHLHLWDDIYYEAEVRTEIAQIARRASERGATPAEAMADVLRYTGEPMNSLRPPIAMRGREPQADDFRAWHRHSFAFGLAHTPARNDDAVLKKLIGWLDTPRPRLHRA
jgi:hypothetical protein